MALTNQYLIELLESGTETSFKIVYKHFYSRLFFFVSEFIEPRDIVENILQDTFLTLWEKRTQLKSGTNLNAYLYTIARNNSLKKLRSEKYKRMIFLSGSVSEKELKLNTEALENVNTSDILFNEIETIIQYTIESLPPQCKTVFFKSRFQHMKNQQIAEETGISVKTVGSQRLKLMPILNWFRIRHGNKIQS